MVPECIINNCCMFGCTYDLIDSTAFVEDNVFLIVCSALERDFACETLNNSPFLQIEEDFFKLCEFSFCCFL